MRRWLVAILVIGVSAGSPAMVLPVGAAEGATLTVDPSTEIVDGELLSFAATGLASGIGVLSLQCVDALWTPESTLAAACSLEGAGSFELGAPTSFSGTINAVRRLTIDETTYDCGTSQCSIVVTVTNAITLDEPHEQALFAPIDFVDAPSMLVTPDTDLGDSDEVLVSVRTWPSAGNLTSVGVCVAAWLDGLDTDLEAACDTRPGPVISGAPESFDTAIVAHRVNHTGDGATFDCTEVQCVVAAASFADLVTVEIARLLTAPVEFAPAPVLTVDPSTDLYDGQQVSFEATGLTNGFGVLSLLCVDALWTDASTSVNEACSYEGAGPFEIGAPTSFSGTINAVRRLTIGGTVHDCRTTACSVVVVVTEGPFATEPPLQSVSRPISFAVPAIHLSPSTNLADGQTVAVTATGLPAPPGSVGVIVQCGFAPPGGFVCGNAGSVIAPATSSMTGSIEIRRFFTAGDTTVDCAIHPCGIGIATVSGDEGVLAATGVGIGPVT